MRSSSIFAAFAIALALALLSSTALPQAPQPPPPGAPWSPAPSAPPTAQPGAPAPPPGSGAPPNYPAQAPAQGTPGATPAPPAGASPGQSPNYGPTTGAPAVAPAPTEAAPVAAGSFGASIDTQQAATQQAASATTPAEEIAEERARSLQEHNSMQGSTGLLHTVGAGSGATGTFRVHFLMDWFEASSFLCFGGTPCPLAGSATGRPTDSDSVDHFGANVGLSVTPIEFLEAYGTIRSSSTYNDRGFPRLLQVLGDTTLGIKAFTPNKLGQALNFGGAADLLLLNGSGGVGLDGSSTSLRLNALGTLDLRQPNDAGTPLRIHLNLGYLFDNSGALISDVETQRKALRDQRGDTVTRIERFGLGVNRVDQLLISFGAEAIFPAARPFLEYHVGIAANRQGYECVARPRVPNGDTCLHDASFSGMPSTLTLGVRAYPFLRGFEVLAALDIGITGHSDFVEELAPTPPWNLFIGAGYAFDAQEPPVKTQLVERVVAATVAPTLRIRGFVREKNKPDGIANAVVRFEGRDMTGLVTSADGHFVSAPVDPGTYTMSVSADGYNEGKCSVVVAPAGAAAAAPGASYGAAPGGALAPPAPPNQQGMPAPLGPAPPNVAPPGTLPPVAPGWSAPAPAAGPAPPAGGSQLFEVDCPVEPAPRVGTVNGSALDADTNTPVNGVAIRVVDTQGKEVGVAADGNGAFRMEGLQPGTVTVKAEADGYMLHVQTAEVRAREETRVDLMMHKRPKKGDVEIAGNEIKIKKQIHFETDSAKISLDSTGLLEEIADTLLRNLCLKQVEIQGHTDNTGTKEHNKILSEQRANSVREWLLAHNVDPGRLIAVGYGQERPISPNVTPAGKERNRRVQFIIKDQDKGCGKAAPAAGAKPAGEKAKPALPF